MISGNKLLTRAECNALRGIAIIGIFLHNYCHWLGPIVKENEYMYFQRNVDRLNDAVAHPDALLPVHLLSFFGHYGVPVFLFLSAYGLVMKYERTLRVTTEEEESAWTFIRQHFAKLFRMMIYGFAAFTMVDAITPGPHKYHVLDIVAQLLMVNNVLPNPDHLIWPGPYWFFGLMLQLYAVYRLVLYRRHWGWIVALIVVCTAIQMACGPESEALNRWRYNFVGGMLPFGFGLLFARYGRDPQTPLWYWGTLLTAGWLTMELSQSYWSWYLVPVMVVMCCYGVVKVLPRRAVEGLAWVGSISAALFVCHPITRKIFIPISRHGDIYTGLLLYVVASLVLALLFKRLMKR